jgi:hypothetical protein
MKNKPRTFSPSELFDHQLLTLGRCGISLDGLEALRSLVPDMPYLEGDSLAPFLVVPTWEASLAVKMGFLGEKTSGRTHTDTGMVLLQDESELVDIVELPRTPYLALNYDSGPTNSTVRNLERNPHLRTHRCVLQFQLEPDSRLPATVDEGILSWLYGEGSHGETYTMLMGSRYGEHNPCLFFGQYRVDKSLTYPDGYRPCLGSQPKGYGGNYGHATCAHRVKA